MENNKPLNEYVDKKKEVEKWQHAAERMKRIALLLARTKTAKVKSEGNDEAV